MRPDDGETGTVKDHPGVVAPPPAIFLLPLLLGLALRFGTELPSPSVVLPVRLAVGVPVLLLGAGLAAWGFATMRRARTPVHPGRTPTALVTAGPFALSRNPLYVALAFSYAGIATCLDAPYALALLPCALGVVRQGVVLREERYLEAKFGDEYRSYRARVRRWL